MNLTETEDSIAAPARDPEYTLFPEAIEASGRSLNVVLGDRLCDAAVAKLKAPNGALGMSYKELLKLLRDNCANQDGYLSPQQPVVETAFRMLLTAPGNKLSLSEIHATMSELWMSSPWPRHISIESLKRLLDNSLSYGILAAEDND